MQACRVGHDAAVAAPRFFGHVREHRGRTLHGERGLIRQALSHALARKHNLKLIRRRNTDLLAPADPADPRCAPLRKLVGNLSGSVPNHPDLIWREGIGTRLDWGDDRLWLLFEPRTVMAGVTEDNRGAALRLGLLGGLKTLRRTASQTLRLRPSTFIVSALWRTGTP